MKDNILDSKYVSKIKELTIEEQIKTKDWDLKKAKEAKKLRLIQSLDSEIERLKNEIKIK